MQTILAIGCLDTFSRVISAPSSFFTLIHLRSLYPFFVYLFFKAMLRSSFLLTFQDLGYCHYCLCFLPSKLMVHHHLRFSCLYTYLSLEKHLALQLFHYPLQRFDYISLWFWLYEQWLSLFSPKLFCSKWFGSVFHFFCQVLKLLSLITIF